MLQQTERSVRHAHLRRSDQQQPFGLGANGICLFSIVDISDLEVRSKLGTRKLGKRPQDDALQAVSGLDLELPAGDAIQIVGQLLGHLSAVR